jgi:hypothetical protein
MHTPFDPLRFLQSEMRLSLDLDPKGRIVVEGMNHLLPHQYKQAKAVLKIYDKLLLLQLDAPSKRMRPSIRKLMAQGRIEIREGQYVLS